ncbi:MAG: sulfotransferase family protein, partial [Bacteroidia bacterium]
FALYFYKKYKNKKKWTESDLQKYVDEFWLMSEQNINLYFTSKEQFFKSLLHYKDELDYTLLIRLTYLHFIEPKLKEEVEVIVDKQIKYLYHLPKILEIFPEARFIILVRDVRDNVVAKRGRGLNLNSDPFFLASIWNNTYSNYKFLVEKKRETLVIRYEDLVRETSNTLSEICSFIGIDFSDTMLKTEGVFDLYLEKRKPFLKAEEYEKIKRFNSELGASVNSNKIGVYKQLIDKNTEAKILSLNSDLLHRFGYEVEVKQQKFSLRDRWYKFLAFLYRPALLGFYYSLPFGLKLFIKRIRK